MPLPSNASKERSGTHAELAHRAARLDKAAAKIIAQHQAQDERGEALEDQRQRRIDELQREAKATRDFLARSAKRLNRKGQELKTNVTDPDSAKMATSKGVIQGNAAQAAVDSAHQVIVAAEVIGSGSEQQMLLPMIDKAALREADTVITADAGYHSDANVRALCERGIPAMIADGGMRGRDVSVDRSHHLAKDDPLHDKTEVKPVKLFGPKHFKFNDDNTAICPAGKLLISSGTVVKQGDDHMQRYEARASDCSACSLRAQCLRNPEARRGRQVARFEPRRHRADNPSERMRRAIDSPRGRQLYSQRIATVEPVFANIRHHKRMSRFTLRGQAKVNTQWNLYCLVHNIEKLARRI